MPNTRTTRIVVACVLLAAVAFVLALAPLSAHAQTVCTYTEQTGNVRNCTGVSSFNQVANVQHGSGTIAATNTSQQVFAPNPARTFLIVQNPVSSTTRLYVDFGRGADATSIELAPGGSITFNAGVTPTQSVNVSGTANAAFIAKQG